MVDISNKALALVLVAAIVVSLGGTMVSLNRLGSVGVTGFATSDTGEANLTIETDLSIQFSTALADFGSGYVLAPGPCDLTTNSSADFNSTGYCMNFNDETVPPLVIQNIGNQDATLSLNASVNSSEFFGGGDGGTGDELQWWFAENETGSCSTTLADADAWYDVNKTPEIICPTSGFLAADTTDSLFLHVRIQVPNDAPATGERSVTFLASAS